MDASFFNEMRQIHNSLITEGYIFTDAELKGGIEFSESVNAGEDLSVGSCVMSSIKFSLFDFNYLINEISGKEFTWVQSVQTGKITHKPLVRATQGDVICINGNIAYVAAKHSPFLSIWNSSAFTKISNAAEQPLRPPETLVVVGNKLYCLNSQAPYVTAYRIDGQGLTKISSPSLNRFEEYKVKLYCERRYCVNLQGSDLREFQMQYYDMKPINLLEITYERIQIGLFTAESPVKSNSSLMTVTAYDRLVKFDGYADNWLLELAYPVTMGKMLQGLCQYMGVEAESYTFRNSDFVVQENFIGQNVSGLQILRWIAEAAGYFGRINAQGKLEFGWYEPLEYTLTNHMYTSIQTEDFETNKINKLQIRVVENDIGVIVPSEDPALTNIYIIENNPLLYIADDNEANLKLRPAANKIFDVVKGISYRPYSVNAYENPMIHPGHIITISTPDGLSFPAYIMSKSLKGGFQTLEAVGAKDRTVRADTVNQAIQQIRGSVHEYRNTVDELSSNITEYRKQTDGTLEKHTSQIQQLSGEIVLKVTQSQLNQAISSAETELNKKIIESQAQIKVTTDAIEAEVSQKLDSADFSTTLRQSATSVQIAWNNIDKSIQFEEGELRIYDTSKTPNTIFSKFNYTGSHYYRDGYYVGKIGTGDNSNNVSQKGLVFNLGYNAAYMSWSRANSLQDEESDVFNMIWTYEGPNIQVGTGDHIVGDPTYGTLIASAPIHMRGQKLISANLHDSLEFSGGLSGEVRIGSGTSLTKMTFLDGILTECNGIYGE